MQDLFNSFIYESNSKKAPEINNKAKLITKIERLDKSRFSAIKLTKTLIKILINLKMNYQKME